MSVHEWYSIKYFVALNYQFFFPVHKAIKAVSWLWNRDGLKLVYLATGLAFTSLAVNEANLSRLKMLSLYISRRNKVHI